MIEISANGFRIGHKTTSRMHRISVSPREENVSQDINVVALVKGEERYIFLFNDNQKSQTLRTLGRYASDSKLSFSWYDAAVLSQKVRNIEKDTKPTKDEKSTRVSQSSKSILPPNKFGDSDGDLWSEEDLFSGEDLF